MGAFIATIFTVVVVAISSIVITNPNINFDNRSKAMMTEGGGGNIPKTIAKPTAKPILKPTGTANAQIGATPSPKPTSTPIPCSCVGGHLTGNCGAGTGSPCSANTTTTTPSPTSSGTDLLAEKKECQMNGGAWTNNKCVYPTSTASLPKPTTSNSSASDSCGDGMVCSSISSSSCINGDGEPTPCVKSGGATGNCCSPINQPTTTPTTSPTKAVATVTPTCVKEGGTYKDGVPCCSPLVKVVTPYGAYCGKKGECTPGTKKCQIGGNNTYFEYLCDSSGYFQQNKRCDFGCFNNSCSTGGCTAGQTRCDPSRPNELETCTGTAWSGKSCDYGCETVSSTKAQCKTLSCTNPAGTPNVTKICNDAGGYNYCSSDGKWYSKKCEGTSVCEKGECISKFLKGIGEACASESECQTGYCYSGSDTLGGSPFDTKDTCHANPVSVMDDLKVTEAKGTIIGGAIVAAVAVPEILLVTNVIDDAATISQCALTQDPIACQWAFATVMNPVPGTSVAREVVEESADLLKYTDDAVNIADSFDSVSLRANNALQNVTREETLTLYHGSQGDLESILNNGIYGVADGGPTLSNHMMDTPLEFASGNGVSIMQSSQIKNMGGYIVEVKVPQSKVATTDLADSEIYYALSANNPLQPNASSHNHVALSPNFIKNIYPVSANGVVNSAIPETEWASFASQFNVTRNNVIEEQLYLRLKNMLPNESEEVIQNLFQMYK